MLSSEFALKSTLPVVCTFAFSILAVVFASLLKYATLPPIAFAPIVAATAFVFDLTVLLASTWTFPPFKASTLPPEILAVVLYFISVTRTLAPVDDIPPVKLAFVIFDVS